ncbi:Nuclear control of ATPase protein 2 [Physocladia obscura]|uniref:Nuclear control of ATPase protein 2 n=1 Tax=Physocladia obscura TaxID=109957 RepID=A0AAD5SUB6_9FUNG|nr:Nuclear control of ATPase protein 2 [Physocladia obscura]
MTEIDVRAQLLATALTHGSSNVNGGREATLINALDTLSRGGHGHSLATVQGVLTAVQKAMRDGEDTAATSGGERRVLELVATELVSHARGAVLASARRLADERAVLGRIGRSRTWLAVHAVNERLGVGAVLRGAAKTATRSLGVGLGFLDAARANVAARAWAVGEQQRRHAALLGLLVRAGVGVGVGVGAGTTGDADACLALVALAAHALRASPFAAAAPLPSHVAALVSASASASASSAAAASSPDPASSSDLRSRFDRALAVVRLLDPESEPSPPSAASAQQIVSFAPSTLQLYWLPATLGVSLVVTALSSVSRNKLTIAAAADNLLKTAHAFVADYIMAPLLQIYSTIRHKERRLALMGELSLSSDLDSLERMVLDFAKDHGVTDPALIDQVKSQVANGDLSIVMTRYEDEMKSPFWQSIRGDLIRTLLIQIQKSKVDLELAMSALDKLLQANELNFTIMSSVPVVLLVYATYRQLRYFIRRRRGLGQEQAYDTIRASLQDVERLLNRANRSTTPENINSTTITSTNTNSDTVGSGGGGGGCGNYIDYAEEGNIQGLSFVNYGFLLIELSNLKQLSGRVPPKYRERFAQDLVELSDPQWTVYQRCETVKRMSRFYPFLREEE